MEYYYFELEITNEGFIKVSKCNDFYPNTDNVIAIQGADEMDAKDTLCKRLCDSISNYNNLSDKVDDMGDRISDLVREVRGYDYY